MIHIANPFVRLMARMMKIRVGKKSRFAGFPLLYRGKKASIEIGEHFTLMSTFLSNIGGMNHRSVLVARDEGNIVIGNRVGMSGPTVYAYDRIEIGDDSIIGINTVIMDCDMHPVDPATRLKHKNDKRYVGKRPIKIGKNVFIGYSSIILKGTVIGDNCVVGAGSVVSGQFEDNCVIAGNPARVVKRLEAPKEDER